MQTSSLHLRYLSEQLVGLTFFDANVSAAVKYAMVKSMPREGENEPFKCIKLTIRLIPDGRLEDFVMQNTVGLFDILVAA